MLPPLSGVLVSRRDALSRADRCYCAAERALPFAIKSSRSSPFGCSAGACHGAAAGQGGFKLSLRGYDNEGDYLTITKSVAGPPRLPG